jgi:glutaminase
MAARAIVRELERVRRNHEGNRSGSLAEYIPELAKANPALFGISLCTVDGTVYEVGDTSQPFTIQSVSKPFTFALALADADPDTVLGRVGVEPSGDAFNSILLDASNRPHNPMINAGAITVVSLVSAATPQERFDRILEVLSGFAGRRLEVDEAVYESERATGHRNRAIGHLLRTVGALEGDVDEILDVYFRQCSVLVTSTDLAVMMATLANHGVNPINGRQVADRGAVGDVLSVLYMAGMYDYSGEWAYRIGLPAKSGVSGGVGALVPGQVGVGVFSPLVDDRGNSVRGVHVCKELSERLGFHIFRNGSDALPPIRSLTDGSQRRSIRVRPVAEFEALRSTGRRIGVAELQGPWTFGACEQLMRRVDEIDVDLLVIHTSRVTSVDTSARLLMAELVEAARARRIEPVLAGTGPEGMGPADMRRFRFLDEALEWCEDELLDRLGVRSRAAETLPLEKSDLTHGLSAREIASVAEIGTVRIVAEGSVVTQLGEPSTSMYLVMSGRLSARSGEQRIAAFGPGAMVGEMGFMTGEPRSASVMADTPAILMEFEHFDSLSPAVAAKLFRNIAVVVSERLQVANRALVGLHDVEPPAAATSVDAA